MGIFCALFFTQYTQAASLYVSPSAGTYTDSKTFSVNVLVESADQAMNAVSGNISYPSNILQVRSLSVANSIIKLWVKEPSYANSTGRINFEGLVLNPGYTGNAGNIVTIEFQVIGEGSAPVQFISGSILANDGEGTDILTSFKNGLYQISKAAAPQEVTPPVQTRPTTPPPKPVTTQPSTYIPPAPVINSKTHPEESIWYRDTNPVFSWDVPAGVTAVSAIVDQNPTTIPPTDTKTVISEKKFTEVADGVWYVHVQYRGNGGWGPATHRKFQVDTVSPENLNLIEIQEDDLAIRTAFEITAQDVGSGIDHFDVQINDDALFSVSATNGVGTFVTDILMPGSHSVVVRAVDVAGNYTETQKNFIVSNYDAPIIIGFDESVDAGMNARIDVQSYRNIPLKLTVQNLYGVVTHVEGVADEKGMFQFKTASNLEPGTYIAWVSLDLPIAFEMDSNKITFDIIALSTSWSLSRNMSFILLVSGIGILILFWIWAIWWLIHRRTQSENSTEDEIDTIFVSMEKDIRQDISDQKFSKTQKDFKRREKLLKNKVSQDIAKGNRSVKKTIKGKKK